MMMDFLSRLVEKNLGQGKLAEPLISSQFESERQIVNTSFEDVPHMDEMNADVDNEISTESSKQLSISNHGNLSQFHRDAKAKSFRNQPSNSNQGNLTQFRKKSTVISFRDQPLSVASKYNFEPLVKPIEDKSFHKNIETGNKSYESYSIPKTDLAEERRSNRKISNEDKILPDSNFPINISPHRESFAKLPIEEAGRQSEISSSKPTIKVTIGRVEVKAVPQPISKVQQTTTSNRMVPSLSLDDYLRKRNGGQ